MWYQEEGVDHIIISHRIRLARNLLDYKFPIKINKEEAGQILEVISGVFKELKAYSFKFLAVDTLNNFEKQKLVNIHLISPLFTQIDLPTSVIYNEHQDISIMVNEEDHLRIQCMGGGKDIQKTWEKATHLDDLLSQKLKYAFHKEHGYMTSCVTNVGTGLRASFMVHLPMLSKTGQMIRVFENLQNLGMQIRGMYGEGTKALGDIYQISNQLTLGRSEEDLIALVKNVTDNLVEKEEYIRQNLSEHSRRVLMDKLYRSYGILQYARELSIEEAMDLLSDIKLGFELGGYVATKPHCNIYEMMIMSQNGVILSKTRSKEKYNSLNSLRADEIRKYLGN